MSLFRPGHRRNALSNVLLPYTSSTTSTTSTSRRNSLSGSSSTSTSTSTSSQPSRLHIRRGAVLYQHAPISHDIKVSHRKSVIASVLDAVQPCDPTITTSTTPTICMEPEHTHSRIPSSSFSSMILSTVSSVMSAPSHASSASMSISTTSSTDPTSITERPSFMRVGSTSNLDPTTIDHAIMDIKHDTYTRPRANTTPITMSAPVTPVEPQPTRVRASTVMDWSAQPFLSVNPMYNFGAHIDHIVVVEDSRPPAPPEHSLQERVYIPERSSDSDSDSLWSQSSNSSTSSSSQHRNSISTGSNIAQGRVAQRRHAIVLDRFALINALRAAAVAEATTTPTLSASSLSTIYSDDEQKSDLSMSDHDMEPLQLHIQ